MDINKLKNEPISISKAISIRIPVSLQHWISENNLSATKIFMESCKHLGYDEQKENKKITQEKGIPTERENNKGARNDIHSENHILRVKEKHLRAYDKWTEEEEQELLKLYDEGHKKKEIMNILNRTRGAIHTRLNKLLMEREYQSKINALTEDKRRQYE